MKYRIVLIVTLAFSSYAAGRHGEEIYPEGKVPESSGFISIIVESNINRLLFSCDIGEINVPYREVNYESGVSGSSTIIIPLKDFSCDNKVALNDFLSLLKADKYPDFRIIIPDNDIIKCYDKDSVIFRELSANVAGVTKKYDVALGIENLNNSFCLLSGTLRILLSDLNIKPPVKYFGLVKVKNEVLVKFELYIKNTGTIAAKN